MKHLNQYINEKFKIKKDINIDGIITITSLDELKKIIQNRTQDLDNTGILDVSDLDISNLTSLKDVFNFRGNDSIRKIIGLSDWDVSNIISLQGLFHELCITEVDISDWDISNCENISFMFKECRYLRYIGDISNWNTKNLKEMKYMFYGCKQLDYIGNINNWDIKNLENSEYAFANCEKLKLDISNWEVKKINTNNYTICITLNAPKIKI